MPHLLLLFSDQSKQAACSPLHSGATRHPPRGKTPPTWPERFLFLPPFLGEPPFLFWKVAHQRIVMIGNAIVKFSTCCFTRTTHARRRNTMFATMKLIGGAGGLLRRCTAIAAAHAARTSQLTSAAALRFGPSTVALRQASPAAAAAARQLHTCAPSFHFAKRAVWKHQKEAAARGRAPPEFADDNNVSFLFFVPFFFSTNHFSCSFVACCLSFGQISCVFFAPPPLCVCVCVSARECM